MNTNLLALGALAILCRSGCTATVHPAGGVYTYYAPAVEESVVVESAPVVVVQQPQPVVRPLFPLLVSYHSPAPRPAGHIHHSPAPKVLHTPKVSHGPKISAKPAVPTKSVHRGGQPSSHGKISGGGALGKIGGGKGQSSSHAKSSGAGHGPGKK